MRAILVPAALFEAMSETDVPREWVTLARQIGASYIERVVVGSVATRERFPFVMVVDEEGVHNHKPENLRASLLYGRDIHGGRIYGDALLLGEGMDGEGEVDFTDLPAHITVHTISDYIYDPFTHTPRLMGA